MKTFSSDQSRTSFFSFSIPRMTRSVNVKKRGRFPLFYIFFSKTDFCKIAFSTKIATIFVEKALILLAILFFVELVFRPLKAFLGVFFFLQSRFLKF
jgi:hypothetical protein